MTKNNDKSKDVQYLTIKEEREIARSNRKIMKQFEKAQNRKNVDESEFTTTMRDPRNVIEIDNLHTYFLYRCRYY